MLGLHCKCECHLYEVGGDIEEHDRFRKWDLGLQMGQCEGVAT